MSQVSDCKQLYADGVAIREIARRLEISRNTVRRYLRGAVPGAYRQENARPQPAQDKVRQRVVDLLEAEAKSDTRKKQRLTAARVHELLGKSGADVSERTVRSVVAGARMSRRDPLEHAYLPLEYDPGVDAQVDFMEVDVDDVVQGRIRVYVLSVRAGYSRRAFRYAAPNQTREALLEGLIQAFEFFGGVFRCLWFDNLTPVVKKVLKGRNRQTQDGFESFRAHYGFTAEFCRPGKGNEKGGVEKDVQWVQQRCFSPIPKVDGRSGVQKLLDDMARRELDRTVRGCDASIGELWKAESKALMPLPGIRFDASRVLMAKVSNRSWVQTGTNYYSVPVALVGQDVTVRVSAETIAISTRGGEVARHVRSYGRGRMSLQLEHYLPLLERKQRGLDRAVPVRQWLQEAPKAWRQMLERLRQTFGEVEGSRHFIDMLKLVEVHGRDDVTSALEEAMFGEPSLEAVRFYLDKRREDATPAPPVICYAGPTVPPASTAIYQEVYCG